MGLRIKVGLTVLVLCGCFLLQGSRSLAATSGPVVSMSSESLPQSIYSEINLSNGNESTPLTVTITHDQSSAYQWAPEQTVKIEAYAEHKNGKKEFLKDRAGNVSWEVALNANGEATLSVLPDTKNFSGRLTVKGNGKMLYAPTPYLGEALGKVLEKVYEYRFNDGAKLKVYFTDELLEESGVDNYFAKDVLDAAVTAYQTITQFQGFKSPGFSFVSPDEHYAYSPDKTVHIYLGDSNETNGFTTHGFNALSFKDAPCFDTIRLSETAYQAVILLPINYKEFIKNWEHINPSPLGTRNVDVDLRGTLIHEMLHVIIFYYNKNLNNDKNFDTKPETTEVVTPARPKKLDWYVEGLARYFETFAGARHDFYSQGFKQFLPGKTRFSRGGSNYFMRYPDQAFTDLRYENALFWRYIDYHFGMAAIEQLSRDFRSYDQEDFRVVLEKITGVSFKQLLKDYASAILLKDFGLKDDSIYLKDIARTHLVYKNSQLYLKDGFGDLKLLGNACKTDWIGEWADQRAKSGEPSVAGDSTDTSDVSGWATDYYEMELAPEVSSLPWLGVRHQTEGSPLAIQFMIVSKGGSIIKRQIEEIFSYETKGLGLNEEIKKEGLEAKDIDKIYVLITNTDAKVPAEYEIQTKS